MRSSSFFLQAADGLALCVHRWLPDGAPQAVIQIAHGVAGRAGRYARLAAELKAHGRVTISIATSRAYLETEPLRSRLAVRSAKLSADPQ